MRLMAICLTVVFGAALGCGAGPADHSSQKPTVVLTLDSATAERGANGSVLFKCIATIENNTGSELKVQSKYFSPFDGLVLVVQDAGGRILMVQPYSLHQSPFGTRRYSLPLGKTTKELSIPVSNLPTAQARFKVQFVGTLEGSGVKQKLSSNVYEVSVQAN